MASGYDIVELDVDLVSYRFNDRGMSIGFDESGVACYAFTPYQFPILVPREVDDFFKQRNRDLTYGAWALPEIEDHRALVFRLGIETDDFDLELFQIATRKAHSERADVEEIFVNAGFLPA